jgi:hypothetical protein
MDVAILIAPSVQKHRLRNLIERSLLALMEPS